MTVEDASFEVLRGEIFALLGPKGAGKTTTLECLEGLHHAGRVTTVRRNVYVGQVMRASEATRIFPYLSGQTSATSAAGFQVFFQHCCFIILL